MIDINVETKMHSNVFLMVFWQLVDTCSDHDDTMV